MAMTFSDPLVNDLLDTLATVFPEGAVLEMRSGAAPAIDAAATGTVIATITLPATPWAAASDRSKELSGTWQDTSADAAGTLGHFRVRQADDDNSADDTKRRIQGSITLTGGGGDMTVDNTNAQAGQQIVITGFTISIPA
jgi:hypothetical protein